MDPYITQGRTGSNGPTIILAEKRTIGGAIGATPLPPGLIKPKPKIIVENKKPGSKKMLYLVILLILGGAFFIFNEKDVSTSTQSPGRDIYRMSRMGKSIRRM